MTHPRFTDDAAIDALVAGLRARTLPVADFTHHAHVAATSWFLERHSIDAATCLLRSGIAVYNELCGPGNRVDGGYHETLTLFWIGAVAHHRARQDPRDPLHARVVALLAGDLGRSDYPRDFYSGDRLMSQAARARWVGPDRRPLPWSWPL